MLGNDETTFPIQNALEDCSSKGRYQDVLIPVASQTATSSAQFQGPVEQTSTATLLPPSRVYWGTSDSHLWQYKVEVPSCLVGDDDQVLVRARPLYKTCSTSNKKQLEVGLASCLIGCRLVEFSKEGIEGLRGSVLTSVMVCPSSTWVSPCGLPLSSIIADLHRHHHHSRRLGLCITLDFSDVSCTDHIEILSLIQRVAA